MSAPPITIDMNDSMQDAIKLIRENNINMLPVINKQRLVGVVTDGDLKRASASDATTLEIHELLYLITKIKIKDILTKDPITVLPDFSVEETAEVLLKNRISGVPVMDVKGLVLGIITQNDLFRVLISLTGVEKKRGTVCFSH
jgi:acetoin utilization protein AcuB